MKKCFHLFSGEQGKDVALLLLRIALGGVFLAHGVQKLMGMDGVIQFFGMIGFSPLVAWFVAIIETVIGIAMIAGVMTNVAAWLMVIILIVAIVKVHLTKGFWSMGGGYEYQLFMILSAIAVAHLGHGSYALCKHKEGEKCGSCDNCAVK